MEEDQGIYARIPIGDLSLGEAANIVDDASWWDETMPPVIYFYRLSVDDYWKLTVIQHRLLVDWLESNGLVKNGDST